MKNNFMYLSSMLLVGVSSIEASQQQIPQSRLPAAYRDLRNDTMGQLIGDADKNKVALDAFQTNADAIATILSPDPKVSYKTRREAFLALMGNKILDGVVVTIKAAAFSENKAVIDFLYKCYALDTLQKSGGLSTMQDFFTNFLEDRIFSSAFTRQFQGLLNRAKDAMAKEIARKAQEQIESVNENAELTDEKLLRLNELLKTPGVAANFNKIKNPLVKALAASLIIGKPSGMEHTVIDEAYNNNFNDIAKALETPGFFSKYPNTWATLAKQSLDGIIEASNKKIIRQKEMQQRSTQIHSLELIFRSSIPKRSSASKLGGWFREYCSISKLVLKARSAFMSDEERYKTAMDLVKSLQPGSRVDPRDVCRSIGIALRNLSDKDDISGQPEKLLESLSKKNVTVAMVTDEIISRIPAIRATRYSTQTTLRALFMKGLGDLRTTSISSLDNVETRTAFDPATVQTTTTVRNPKGAGATSIRTNTTKGGSGNTTRTPELTPLQQKQAQKRREEQDKELEAERKRQGISYTEPTEEEHA